MNKLSKTEYMKNYLIEIYGESDKRLIEKKVKYLLNELSEVALRELEEKIEKMDLDTIRGIRKNINKLEKGN